MTGTHQGYKFLSRSARTNLPCSNPEGVKRYHTQIYTARKDGLFLSGPDGKTPVVLDNCWPSMTAGGRCLRFLPQPRGNCIANYVGVLQGNGERRPSQLCNFKDSQK